MSERTSRKVEISNEKEETSSSEESSSDDENGEVEVNNIEPTESLATTRSRRANAGNRLSRLLDAEEGVDDFYKTTYGGFDDAEDDEEFNADENEAEDIVDSDFDIDETQDPGQDEATAEAEAVAADKKEQSKKTLSYRDPKAKRKQPKKKDKTGTSDDESAPKSSLALALEAASNSTQICIPSTSKAVKKEQPRPRLDKPTVVVSSFKKHIPIAKNLRDSTKRHSKEVKDMLVKRNRQQARQKAKLRQKKAQQAGERVPQTQEEMLEEAKQTEIDNLRSLEEYRNAEVEKVKRNKAVSRNLTNLPMIRHRSWIEEVDELDEKNEPTSKKRKVVRSYVIFPDEPSKSKYFPTDDVIKAKSKALEKALSVPDRMCIVRSCMAKYLDPLTGLPYSDEAAFKYIRTQYIKYLADQPQLKEHPIVKAFLAQTNDRHRQILLNSEGRIHSVKTPISFRGSAANIKHAVVVVNKIINNGQDKSNLKTSLVPIAVAAGDGKKPIFITQMTPGSNKQSTSIVAVAVSSPPNINEVGTDSQTSAATTPITTTTTTTMTPIMTTTNTPNIRIVSTSKGSNLLQQATPFTLAAMTPISAGGTLAATTLPGGQLMVVNSGQFQYIHRAPGSQLTTRPTKQVKRSISTPIVRNTTVSVTPTSVSLLGQMPPRTLPSASSTSGVVVNTQQQQQPQQQQPSQPMTIMTIPMSTAASSSAAASSTGGQQAGTKTVVFSSNNTSTPIQVISSANLVASSSGGITKTILKSVTGSVVGAPISVGTNQQQQTFQIQRGARPTLTTTNLVAMQRNALNGRRLYFRPAQSKTILTPMPVSTETAVVSGGGGGGGGVTAEPTLVPVSSTGALTVVSSDGALPTLISSGVTSNPVQVTAAKVITTQTIKVSSGQQQPQPQQATLVLNNSTNSKTLVTPTLVSVPLPMAPVSSSAGAAAVVATPVVVPSSSTSFAASATTSTTMTSSSTTELISTSTTTTTTTSSSVSTSA